MGENLEKIFVVKNPKDTKLNLHLRTNGQRDDVTDFRVQTVRDDGTDARLDYKESALM